MFHVLLYVTYVHSSVEIILIGMRELAALLSLSSWHLVIIVGFFLAVQWVCLQSVMVVSPDHTHLLFIKQNNKTCFLQPLISRSELVFKTYYPLMQYRNIAEWSLVKQLFY